MGLIRNMLELLCGAEIFLPSWKFIEPKRLSHRLWLWHVWWVLSDRPANWRPADAEVRTAVSEVVEAIHPAYLDDWSRLARGHEMLSLAYVAACTFDLTWPPRFMELLDSESRLLG